VAENVSTRGAAAAGPLSAEDRAALIDQQLGDSNMQKRGLGTGVVKDRGFRGQHDEQFRFISGMTGNAQVVTVEHDLGRVPGYVSLKGTRVPVGANPAHVTVADVSYDQWTDTTARVEIMLQGPGGLDNITVVLLVGGERG
jgi:hypothetical protein